MISFTISQQERLTELGLDSEQMQQSFQDCKEREAAYRQIEKQLVRENKRQIAALLEKEHRTKLCQLQEDIAAALCEAGFTQITTPTIISRKFLDRMSVDETHPLNEQVFWLDVKNCLRPMLAPNLYEVSKQLLKIRKPPLRIFEIGSCFRKESEGKSHLKEFTMVNLVEWGTELEERTERLKEFAAILMKAAGIEDYLLEEEESIVYGKGLDIVSLDGLELASTSMGPHPLDDAWEIDSSWVGIGSGLERLLMHREKQQGIHRHSKSISYLNGARLNIK